jgi:pimeloyl-ACP methyl ester carboxylesterase
VNNQHSVIIIPGLGDRVQQLTRYTRCLKTQGLNIIIHPIGWHDGLDFNSKLPILLDLIDKLISDGDTVSLVGCSAGASAAFNAFIQRKNVIHRVVNICGRLRTGNDRGFRSLSSRARTSKSFKQSVELFEGKEFLLNSEDRQKILTIRPLFGDELVPASTAIVVGAYNITLPVIEHSFAIYTALTLFSSRIINFIKN